MEEDTFYQQVTRSCQSLLVCVKNLGVGVQEGSEEGVVQGIQQTAAAVMALTDVLQDQAERLGDQPSFHQVKVLVEETRLYVLSFIRQSKKVFANPLDYLTLQEFDVTKRMVSDSVKKIVEHLRSVSNDSKVDSQHGSLHAVAEEGDFSGSESGSVTTETSETSSLHPLISVERTDSSDSVDSDLAAKISARSTSLRLPSLPDDNESLYSSSKKLILSVLVLTDDVEAGDIHKFKANAKQFVVMLDQWRSDFEAFDCEVTKRAKISNELKSIPEDCKKMLAVATVIFSPNSEPHQKEAYFQFRDQIVERVRQVLILASGSPISPRRSPRYGASPAIPEEAEEAEEGYKAYCSEQSRESSPRMAKSPRVREGRVKHKNSKRSVGRAHSAKKGLLLEDNSDPPVTMAKLETIFSEPKSSKSDESSGKSSKSDSDGSTPSSRTRPNFARSDKSTGLESVPESGESSKRKRLQKACAESVIKALKSQDPAFATFYDSKTSAEQRAFQKIVTSELQSFVDLQPINLTNSAPPSSIVAPPSGGKKVRRSSIPEQDKGGERPPRHPTAQALTDGMRMMKAGTSPQLRSSASSPSLRLPEIGNSRLSEKEKVREASSPRGEHKSDHGRAAKTDRGASRDRKEEKKFKSEAKDSKEAKKDDRSQTESKEEKDDEGKKSVVDAKIEPKDSGSPKGRDSPTLTKATESKSDLRAEKKEKSLFSKGDDVKDASMPFRSITHRTSSQFLQPTPRALTKKEKDKKKKKGEEEASDLKELKEFMTMSDLDKMTIKSKGKKKSKFKLLEVQEGGDTPLSNLSRKIFLCSRLMGGNFQELFSDDCLKLLRHAISIVDKFESSMGPVPDDGKMRVYYHFLNSIATELGRATDQLLPLVFVDDNSPLLKVLSPLNPLRTDQPSFKGEVIQLDQNLLKTGNFSFYIQSTLLPSLQTKINSMFFTASQIVTDVTELSSAISAGSGAKEEMPLLQTALHFLCLSTNYIDLGKRVADDFETLFFLRDYVPPEVTSENSFSMSVWDCEVPSLDVMFEPALLPELIVRWTPSTTAPPLEFQKTLLLTWPMFTSPSLMLHFLIERWRCPASLPKDQVNLIRSRVLKALEQWLHTSYYYIDESGRQQIQAFVEEAGTNCNALLAKSLTAVKEILESSQNFFSVKSTFRSHVSKDQIPAWEGTVLPHALVLEFDEKIIAEQLTLIEFDIYKNIKPRELLGQAWTKEKQQCISRNVVDLIQRANYVSYWVASSILFQNYQRLHNRITVINKFISIAHHLRELNNFNTIMGIIAGLNYGPVSRLRHSFAGLKKNNRILEELQDVMSPSGAYKKYRDTLEGAGQSVVPYIGVSLADLTHIDENEDFVTPKDKKPAPPGFPYINFTKQHLTFVAIDKLTKYQSTADYSSIQRAEPLFTFLYSLPKLDIQHAQMMKYCIAYQMN